MGMLYLKPQWMTPGKRVWAGIDHHIVNIQGISQMDELQESPLYIKTKKKSGHKHTFGNERFLNFIQNYNYIISYLQTIHLPCIYNTHSKFINC
jgi:hypothetical protein